MRYEFDGFAVDADRRLLFAPDGEPIPLKPKVFDTLLYMVEHAGQLLDKRSLMAAIWGDVIVEENSLNQHISALRRILGEEPGENRFIVTVPGRGYRFSAPVRATPATGIAPDAPAPEPRDGTSRNVAPVGASGIRRRPRTSVSLAWFTAGMVLAGAVIGLASVGLGPEPPVQAPAVELKRLTDLIGNEESPAISPDGKTVAFVARVGGARQIWVQLLAGGAPLQITAGSVDHEEPRWAPDSSSLIFFTPSTTPGEAGTVWEVAALGGDPRRLTLALAGGDISHDGRHLAVFRFEGDRVQLATLTRDGARTVHTRDMEAGGSYLAPRWSPDDRWLAFQRFDVAFSQRLFVAPAAGDGDITEVANSSRLAGYTWLGDSERIVYSSAAGSTVLYPPTTNLHVIQRDGGRDRQLTFGDVSYSQPDAHESGAIVASRTRIQSDLWRFPADGSPRQNTLEAFRITKQTGQLQTVSVSPDGTEIAYLSDNGGHGNVWVARTDGSSARQITFERDPAVSIGVPTWSSTGREIAFIHNRLGRTGLAGVRPDGSGLREIVATGIGANWSGDDRWLYYNVLRDGVQCIDKLPLGGGAAETVRCDNAMAPAITADGSTLYYVRYLDITNGVLDAEIRRATPEHADSTVLARVSGTRVPVTPGQLVPTLSSDGTALAMPLIDGATTNIWLLPTDGGGMRPITDFGDRAVIIARRVAWSPDGKFVYASVADVDSDVMLLEGLLAAGTR